VSTRVADGRSSGRQLGWLACGRSRSPRSKDLLDRDGGRRRRPLRVVLEGVPSPRQLDPQHEGHAEREHREHRGDRDHGVVQVAVRPQLVASPSSSPMTFDVPPQTAPSTSSSQSRLSCPRPALDHRLNDELSRCPGPTSPAEIRRFLCESSLG
jgi:hypothetical protein